jgi:hypothetical protein
VKGADWRQLSKSQNKVGAIPEAIKSMERAVECTRVGNPNHPALLNRLILANLSGELATLYPFAGRREDANRLRREANDLED